MVGAAIESLAPGQWVLVVGRLTVGFGVGVASVAAPLYAAEQAPSRLRGRFVSTYQLAITIGIFIAYLVDQALTNNDDWRLMLGVSAVPGPAARHRHGADAGHAPVAHEGRAPRRMRQRH